MLGAVKASGACLLDFFYPPACAVCRGKVKDGSELLCVSCMKKMLPVAGANNCPRCGMPADEKTRECALCAGLDSSLGMVLSTTWFMGPVPDVVHRLKYRGMHRLAWPIARLMAGYPAAKSVVQTADILIPVPLYFWRKLRRGYNQSEKIAAALAEICGKELETGALFRIRNTRTQTRLSVDQRKLNVAGAFRVKKPEAVARRVVCLVDDVLTTGATVSACATTLRESGARRVMAYTFARA